MSSSDKLIIETPEQTSLVFTLAGIGSRGLALVIDSLLQVAVLLVLGIFAGLITFWGPLPALGKQWIYAILIFVVFLLQFGYYVFFETIWNGRTPGKRWTHLRVITDSGRPIGTQAAVLRNLMRIVDSLPSLYAIGIITSLISSENKRVGDYIAGTVVIQEKSVPADASRWDSPAAPSLTASQARPLAPAELQLVETFLERRASLQDDVRRAMARQIADKLSHVQSTLTDADQDPEKLLESAAERSRNVAHFR